MIHVTFNGALCESLKQIRPNMKQGDEVVLLHYILEVGDLVSHEDSKVNAEIYKIVAGENAYSIFRKEVNSILSMFAIIDENEEICFWVDFNDVRQHLNMAYFIRYFKRFKNKFVIDFDYNKFCEIGQDVVLSYSNRKVAMSENVYNFLLDELAMLKRCSNLVYRTVENRILVPVKSDYFDKYIFEFLSEKPRFFGNIISGIFSRFGRLAVSFDQVVVRISELVKEGIVERVATKTEYGMLFEYQYKLADHIDMQKDI